MKLLRRFLRYYSICAIPLLGMAPRALAADQELRGLNVTVRPLSDGTVEVSLDEQGLAGTLGNSGERILERSTDMRQWDELARLPVSSEAKQFVDENPPAGSGFYRVRVESLPAYAPGELLVQFRDDADPLALEELSEAAGLISPLEVIETRAMTDTGAPPVTLFSTSMDPVQACTILIASPLVLSASPNMQAAPDAITNDPLVADGSLWGMSAEGFGSAAFTAWGQGKTGSNDVVVAVIDSGVDMTHPDLVANLFSNPAEIPGNRIDDDGNGYVDDVSGWDFMNDDASPNDERGHGTHVAGTIGAAGNNGIGVAGVSWSVKILPLKVFGAHGGTDTGTIVSAIDYVTDLRRRGVNIVAMNLSLGTDPHPSALIGRDAVLFRSALVRAADAGVIAVCAAGNRTNNNDLLPVLPSSIDTSNGPAGVPLASWDNVISISAINRGGLMAWYSNYGASSVDLAAPGGDVGGLIVSTLPGGRYGGDAGTSMAAPHVTGAIALYSSLWRADGAQIRKALLGSAVATPSQRGRTSTGGRLVIPAFLGQGPGQSNRNPNVRDDVVLLASRQPAEIAPLANDTDPDGHSLSVAGFTSGRAGTVARKPGSPSILIYTPGANFNGKDTFSYTAADTAGGTALGSVTVMEPARTNLPPVANDDKVVVEEGESLNLRALLWNDRDPNGDRIRLHHAGDDAGWGPPKGKVSSSEYMPPPGFTGADLFGYSITDGTFIARAVVHVEVVRKGGAPGGKVQLLQPEDSRAKVRRAPLFKWKAVRGAVSYDLEISLNKPGRWLRGYTAITTREFRIPAADALPGNIKCFWRVRPVGANGAPGLWSAYRSFTSRAAAPPDKKPRLISPALDAASVPALPSFNWEDVEDADSYIVQISRGLPETTGIAAGYSVEIEGKSWQLPSSLALESGQIYFWRVMPKNDEGDGFWAEWQPFTCGTSVPTGVPILRSPANGATGAATSPSFDWDDLSGSTGWQIQIRRASNRAVIFESAGIGQSGYTLPAVLAPGIAYEWRVLPSNAAGTGYWSDWWKFTTRTETPVSLLLPAKDATGLGRNVTLQWSSAAGADGYDFEVLQGSTMVAGYGINYSDGPYRGTSVSLTLDYGKTYRWRARARILPQDNPWTPYWSFTIKDAPPFLLLTPDDAATGLGRNVNLSWSSHPDADGYDFEVYDGGIKVAGMGMTYDGGPYRGTSVTVSLEYGKTYTWRARPRILPQDNPWYGSRRFTIKGDPGFALVSPGNGSVGLATSVRLDWSGHPDADGYDFEVYDGGTKVAGMGVTYDGGPYRGTAVTVNLGYGKTYTWRARPRILPQNNPWSATWSFSTEPPPPVIPGVPVLVAPAHHAANMARPVTFDWQAAPNAVRYRLEVWYQPSGGGARQRVLNKTVTATGYKAGSPDPDPLGPGRNYYWKVVGINSAGQEGSWSAERHFSTRTTN